MKCSACSTEVADDAIFCDACGARIVVDAVEPDWPAPPMAGFRGGVAPTVPASHGREVARTLPGTPLLLGDGEVLWRQYRVSQLRSRDQGEGILFVTDARVVFYASARGRGTQRASALVQQTKVGDVTGLTAYVSHRIGLGWFLVAFLLALIFLGTLISQNWVAAIVFALLLAGAAAMIIRGAAKRGSIGVQIHSGATQQSPIGFGQFEEQRGLLSRIIHNFTAPFLSLLGVHTAFDVLVGFPGQDAEQVIAELGALIFDLQTRGSLAGTHWGISTD